MAADYDKKDGANYAPKGEKNIVCKPGEFIVGACGLAHGHINGMCNGLSEAGATIGFVYDPDPEKVKEFIKMFPSAKALPSQEALMNTKEIKLVASAGIANERCGIGLDALDHGKFYFSDKPPMTTQAQVEEARTKVRKTGLKWFVYYAERLHVESAIYAEQLIKEGRIGEIVSIKGWGPHRTGLSKRPEWFFKKEQYGGIITDIGSHQLEQVLYYADAKDARLISSRVGNLKHPQYPELEDYGDATFITDNGIPCYISVDWFTPDGLSTWGDGRLWICGTKGYIEIRKYVDVAASKEADHVIVVDEKGEYHYNVHGKIGFPYFGKLILDCLNNTETAMSQEHTFRAIELAIEAERKAVIIK
ncbi:Gfo/Idh/MocA family oxidoreductase [Treponema parvum]|uniref:Gfo/Idh/MocA family oxidoreductase n=1 Tax=Treponema parvum TaxID=138851 RepID=A0A975EY54_9SPIR|nr:Gfo/Idh/MocA family oxidoreductase [Treponema parvum]QTQ10942.1 Gfo/Idh/MocA family oxidoreductase [Treponema parvum]